MSTCQKRKSSKIQCSVILCKERGTTVQQLSQLDCCLSLRFVSLPTKKNFIFATY